MAYVALSRVSSLDGLYLLSLNPAKIQASPKVLEYYAAVRNSENNNKTNQHDANQEKCNNSLE